ncbi:MAG: 23S rRNA (uracil(1939)-C(5))-methyltransferase RlmD [Deltaproteobacteria bacterium]|nr:23S rRNA (uracil(1939)-C(5))-methyltransferase RlmD [Deltaproteobacteria bacterium]MBW2139348.1 23S rRNA (uracil(1939)-C(5))-methyltransferase RlmD [Deltaproteobacteria bacterium]
MLTRAPKRGDLVELCVERLAYGGQGVSRLDGYVLFVKGGLPGDRVLGRIVKKKRDYAEARILELIEPSPERIEPPCPYHGFCGGCQWQHLRYERQLRYKREHVLEALTRIGGLQGVRVHDAIPSEGQFSYRNKMEFSFSDRRWYPPDEFERRRGETRKDWALGLHIPGTFSKVIDLDACLLQEEEGNRILQDVKRLVKESGVPVYGLKSHQGFWRFLTLRSSFSYGAWMVNLVTAREERGMLEPLAHTLRRLHPSIKTVVNSINTKRAAIALGEREVVLFGGGIIRDRIGPYEFRISANSFFQTNSLTAQVLYNKVLEYAQLDGSEVVLDLYSGTGTIPVFLSRSAREVIGLELERSAVNDAIANARKNGIDNCRFICGDIRNTLPSLRLVPDVLVIDPPRAGLHKDILSQVLELPVGRIVYVSCNPTTLARDLGAMSQDYEIVEVQPVDMFPHTYHVESVARLVRRN